MSTTNRGFVQRIEIGRGGLTSVTLIHADGTTGVYVIHDLDSDPERFNERLSKLGVLRDAMNRAEPVEIEHDTTDAGEEILRAARISRDTLDPNAAVEIVRGLALNLMIQANNLPTTDGELADRADFTMLKSDLSSDNYYLDLQIPERQVAIAQLEMLREAVRSSLLVVLLVEKASDKNMTGPRRVYSVVIYYNYNAFGGERAEEVSGFVESLGVIIPVSSPINLALVHFTTAPKFSGPGGVVGLVPFTPVTITLFVPQSSPSYALFEAGLRDNLRMRVKVLPMDATQGQTTGGTNEVAADKETFTAVKPMTLFLRGISSYTHGSIGEETPPVTPPVDLTPETTYLALSAELLSEYASASRPVWVKVSRETLDHGPDGYKCTPGVPSSDLTPLSLRDLHLPYPAMWTGWGCFNKGIYRFQLKLLTEYRLFVDGKELCLHDATDPGIKMAHACLCGEHEVTVKIKDWKCEYDFVMDVYQLR